MAAKSPLQKVKDNGGREKLVSDLTGMVDDLRDEGATALTSRLSRLSNKKLIRLYEIENKVREKFGDRAKLVDHIIEVRTTAGLTADENYKNALASYSKGRLLDLTRQNLAARPAKQTAEQKLKSKRGRKQRERAQSKLAQS
jgi:hypothetical protein